MREWILRQPWAVVGALSIISLVSQMLAIEKYLADWLAAWQNFSRGIIGFLFQWIFDMFDVRMSGPHKDYIAVGIVLFGSITRAAHAVHKKYYPSEPRLGPDFYIPTLFACAVWPNFIITSPVVLLAFLVLKRVDSLPKLTTEEKAQLVDGLRVLGETFAWSLILIAAFYAWGPRPG